MPLTGSNLDLQMKIDVMKNQVAKLNMDSLNVQNQMNQVFVQLDSLEALVKSLSDAVKKGWGISLTYWKFDFFIIESNGVRNKSKNEQGISCGFKIYPNKFLLDLLRFTHF